MASAIRVKRDFSCGGVVWDDERQMVLLVQVQNLSGSKVWTFPKGHPDGQESDEDAAVREVTEETGWACEILNPIMDVQYSYVLKNVKFNKTVRWFFMKPVKEIGTFDPKEILDSRWYGLEEAKRLISYDTDKKLLKRLALSV